MSDKSQLADFQNALNTLLASGKSHAEIMEVLQKDPVFDNYREYINQFDPDMVEVAQELMGKWAKRTQD